jgi:hypothetical protein
MSGSPTEEKQISFQKVPEEMLEMAFSDRCSEDDSYQLSADVKTLLPLKKYLANPRDMFYH